jgi:hypothetical protein
MGNKYQEERRGYALSSEERTAQEHSDELPRIVDYVRTIREVVEYCEIINKEYMIHITIEQTELEQLKDEFSDESHSKHSKREDTVNIKKERIKKEKEVETKLVPHTESTSWRILKFKTVPAPRKAESPHKRALLIILTAPSIKNTKISIENSKNPTLCLNPAKQERSGRRRGLLTRPQCSSIASQLCVQDRRRRGGRIRSRRCRRSRSGLFRLQWRSGGDDGGDGEGTNHSPPFERLRAVVVERREGEKEEKGAVL